MFLVYALHVATFPVDRAWSTGPIAGLRQVWIDPASVADTVRPLASPPAGERVANEAGGGLRFTNPANAWAQIVVNGTALGEITPYATVALSGLSPGWYQVRLRFSSGFERDFVIELVG